MLKMPPAKKKKWSKYNKPTRPVKPAEMLQGKHLIWTVDLKEYATAYLDDEIRAKLAQADELYLADVEYSYSGYSEDRSVEEITLNFYSNQNTPNPNYEVELVEYKRKYTKYREELAWWKAEEKKVLEQKAKVQKEAELKLLAELKEKYEQ